MLAAVFGNTYTQDCNLLIMKIVKLELSDINKIKKIWKSIEKNAGVRSLASKWEWIETWIAVYSDLVTVEVFAGKNDYGYC